MFESLSSLCRLFAQPAVMRDVASGRLHVNNAFRQMLPQNPTARNALVDMLEMSSRHTGAASSASFYDSLKKSFPGQSWKKQVIGSGIDAYFGHDASLLSADTLSTICHEMRTPLNGILGHSKLLLQEDLAANQRTYAKAICDAGAMLLDLVNRLIDSPAAERGFKALSPAPVNLQKLTSHIVETLAPVAAYKGIDIACFCDTPQNIVIDQRYLRHILFNLVGNAINYTKSGGVGLHLHGKKHEDRFNLVCDVLDDGEGLTPEQADKIFQKHHRAHPHRLDVPGSGLGLSISREIAAHMGGNLTVYSKKQVGSRFRFCLNNLPCTRIFGHSIHQPQRSEVIGLLVSSPILARFCIGQLRHAGFTKIILATSAGDMTSLANCSHVGVFLAEWALWRVWRQRNPRAAETSIILINELQRKTTLSRSPFCGRPYLVQPIRGKSLLNQLNAWFGDETACTSISTPKPRRFITAKKTLASPARPVVLPVLIVEDDHVNRILTEALVKKCGYAPYSAANGVSALDMVGRHAFSTVLMDMHMPVMDGMETTKKLRAMGYMDLPIVACTANIQATHRKACLEAGMDDFLPKPLDQYLLKKMLDKWCQQNQDENPSALDSRTATC